MSLLFTVRLGISPCPTCINGSRVVASINNVTFFMPETDLLQAHFLNFNGVFSSDFPGNLPAPCSYTNNNLATKRGKKLYRLDGSRVVASINNVTFFMPETDLLQAHFLNFNGVFSSDFPGNLPAPCSYTNNKLGDQTREETVQIGWKPSRGFD
ncbi:laccase-16-like [Hibiscus syriacus]|uniref:laccase-16-like n=1 Tax=Hibiscus syriacus TaxID=106335 RepID=UPI001922FA77|nr:laccase-16-like [Hibiscus syriacus]